MTAKFIDQTLTSKKAIKPISINEKLNDFIIDAWHKEGVSPKYLRNSTIVLYYSLTAFGFIYYNIYPLVTNERENRKNQEFGDYLGFPQAKFPREITSSFVEQEIAAFKQKYPENIALFEEMARERIKKTEYQKEMRKRIKVNWNASPEEWNKSMSEAFELFSITFKNQEEFKSWYYDRIVSEYQYLISPCFQGTLNTRPNIDASPSVESGISHEVDEIIMESLINRISFEVRARYKQATRAFTGNLFPDLYSLFGRSKNLALMVLTPILYPLMDLLFFSNNLVLYPIHVVATTIVNLVLLTLTSPLIIKQGVQNIFGMYSSSSSTGKEANRSSADVNEQTLVLSTQKSSNTNQLPKPTSSNMRFFDSKPDVNLTGNSVENKFAMA